MTEFKTSRGFRWRYLFAIPVATAIVHIAVTLAAMGDTSHTAYARMAPHLTLNAMQILPPVKPGQQPVPFMSADFRYAMCRFDTSKGPVTVSAVLPDLGWTVGVVRADGTSAYFAAAVPGKQSDVSVTIVPGDDRFLGLPTTSAKEAANAEPRLSVAAREGLAVIRAPDKGLAYRGEIERDLGRARCSATSY